MPNLLDFSSGVHKQFLASLKVFKPASLTSEEEVANAVVVLEDTLDDDSTGPIIHGSLLPDHPYAFEFIVSCMSELFVPY